MRIVRGSTYPVGKEYVSKRFAFELHYFDSIFESTIMAAAHLVDFCKNSVQIYAQWYCNVYHQGYIHSLNQTDCIEFPYCLCIYLLFFTWRRQWWGYRAHKYFMIYIQVSIKPKPCSRRGVYLLLPSKVRRIKRMLSFF